jgi:hypothetical protein
MMKLSLLLSALALSVATMAQQAIPEFKNKVMLLNKDNTLSNLDLTPLGYASTSKMGAASVYMGADGKNAAITFNPNAGNSFIVKIEPGVDPEGVVTLYEFVVERKVRKIYTGRVSMSGLKPVESQTVKLSFSKVQDGVYIIKPLAPLEPGEYIFTVSQPLNSSVTIEVKGFAFSVPE